MTQDEKINLLFDRFVSREDVYAIQWKDGDRGGWSPVVSQKCEHGCKTAVCPHKVFEPLTKEKVVEHLKGKSTLGVYQLDKSSKVKWLCFDIDSNKGVAPDFEALLQVAEQIQNELRSHGIPALIEDSTNKGVHVWVLLEQPLPAHVMLALGRWVMKSESIEVPSDLHVEVFPKQSQSSGRLGNLVRLPFGIHRKSGKRTQLLHPKTHTEVNPEFQWKMLSSYPLVSRDKVREIFDTHGITSSPLPENKKAVSGGGKMYREKSQHCLVHLMNEGAKEGLRDAGVFRLACLMRDYDIPIDLTTAMLYEWNSTKNNPPLEDHEMDGPIQSAYNNPYSAYPCTDHNFDSICSSECHWYESKMKSRQSRKSS